MIIEIMLIILAMISVVVNTIVSVIIIKDTLNNRKWQDRINKEINITDKEFSDRCAEGADFAWRQAEAYKQAKQELEKDLQRQPIITINPNSSQPNDKLHYAYATKQEQKENEQNDRI